MTEDDRAQIRGFAQVAEQIAAICQIMSEALHFDPTTCTTGDAVDGIGGMAAGLANDLSLLEERNT